MVSATRQKEPGGMIFLYQHPGTTLLIGFLLGTTEGFLIAVARTHIIRTLEQHRERKAKARQEEAARLSQEEAALEIEEDRMTCAVCWEDRHPGQQWPFSRCTLCLEHIIAEPALAPTEESQHKKEVALQR